MLFSCCEILLRDKICLCLKSSFALVLSGSMSVLMVW